MAEYLCKNTFFLFLISYYPFAKSDNFLAFFLERNIGRDARTLRVALWENKGQIARGLFDEIFQFLERNMRRGDLLWRVALWENKRQIARGLFDEIFQFLERKIGRGVRMWRVALWENLS
ncbi:MAG: hypothetical protein F6K40_12970 [Okeania sp. SIO3I5]|uniref:hypothetical protein n=1 Tax=Okeania sp. SIO3I5 TaxID=2607805 RepID=UPI0013B816A9|nr:hypothetical protein [Okeania sp. SIO3I5]NEQ37126.1 hypothetical protein [Okeania sp. SIO3I5]